MMTQYGSQRHRVRNDGRRVGTIPVGTIVYIQDGLRPLGQDRFWSPVYRNPWIVEGWFPRHHAPTGTYLANGGHLAQVRSLRTGKVCRVSDWILERSLAA